MRNAKHFTIKLLVVAAAAVVLGSLSAASARPSARCPQIWAPVICDGGKIYPNQCVADSRNARNCVPYTPGI